MAKTEERDAVRQALDYFLNEWLEQIVVSGPRPSAAASRVRIRPAQVKGQTIFQAEEQRGTQAFHRNMDKEETAAYLEELMEGQFRQAQILSGLGRGQILASKKGKLTVSVKKNQNPAQTRIQAPGRAASHNRRKQYILPEGEPVPFLVDLGVMTAEGRIVQSRYDKYRQINRKRQIRKCIEISGYCL